MGQEDPLEEGMTTHSSILAWEMPWTEKPGGLQSTGCKESDVTGCLDNNNREFFCGQVIFRIRKTAKLAA